MSLKRRRILNALCGAAAAVCLCAGVHLLVLQPLTGDPDGQATVPSLIPDTPTSAPYVEESGWESGWDTEWAGAPDGSAPLPAGENGSRRSEGLLAALLLVGGSVLVAVYLFTCFLPEPLLGQDGGALPVLACAAAWCNTHRTAACFLLICALLLYSKELLGWLRAKCPLRWSACHRIAMRVCARFGRGGYGAAALLLCALSALLGGILFRNAFAAAACAIVFAASFACAWRFLRDVNCLSRAIAALPELPQEQPHSEIFRSEEQQLLAQRALQAEAVQTAVSAERFRVELIANVSHDLRTPLTAIIGYGELLQKQPLNEQGAQQLAQLNRKAAYVKDLVDSLFELTKVSSGEAKPNITRIDLIRLLEQTLGIFDDRLSAANLTVKRHYCAPSVMLDTDGARMHQVFANLVGNAVKYAKPDTRIHLTVTRGEGRVCVRMTNVASYEMDFSPEEIVQRFARGDRARTTQGSGIGLAIAETYTASVGGSFRVEIDGEQFSAVTELPETERNS